MPVPSLVLQEPEKISPPGTTQPAPSRALTHSLDGALLMLLMSHPARPWWLGSSRRGDGHSCFCPSRAKFKPRMTMEGQRWPPSANCGHRVPTRSHPRRWLLCPWRGRSHRCSGQCLAGTTTMAGHPPKRVASQTDTLLLSRFAWVQMYVLPKRRGSGWTLGKAPLLREWCSPGQSPWALHPWRGFKTLLDKVPCVCDCHALHGRLDWRPHTPPPAPP